MMKLDDSNYLVPAAGAMEAIDVLLDQSPQTSADMFTAREHPEHPNMWLVTRSCDGAMIADPHWVGSVTPPGWNVQIDTQTKLLVIRNATRSLVLVQTIHSELLNRYQLRSAFALLGIIVR